MSRPVRALFFSCMTLAAAVLSPAIAQPLTSTCGTGAPGLCLSGGRYRVEASWHVPATGARGTGHPIFLSEDTGAFWFFTPDNLELMVKVLNGGAVNGRTWVFYGSLTDVEFELTVTDRITGEQHTWRNPGGTMASQGDTDAFPAPGDPLPDAPDPSLFLPARPVAAGPPFPLKEPGSAWGSSPWLAAMADGSFTAAWMSGDPTGSGLAFGVSSRSFPVPGPPGPEVVLSPLRFDPLPAWIRVARSAQGALAIWANPSPDQPADRSGIAPAAAGDSGTLSGRKLDGSGQPVGGEILLAPVASSGDVAPAPDGGYALVWGQEATGLIQLRKLDADGNPAGAAVPLTSSEQFGYLPAIAPFPGGGYVVVWQQYAAAFSKIGIVAQLVGADLAPQGPAIEVTGFQGRHSRAFVSANASGFVISWTEDEYAVGGRILARRFGRTGQPLGNRIVVRAVPQTILASSESVALRADGGFLVLWTERGALGESDAAMAHLFTAAGAPFGTAFRVHDEAAGRHGGGGVAATPSGWVASWTSGDVPYVRRIDPTCPDGSLGLCLNGGRFRVEATWHVPATGSRGTASPIVLTGDSGALWFFEPANYEMTVKVLDGRGINGHFWVFYASLTDVEVDLTITDTVTGAQRTYHNPPGTMASRADTRAFPE